MSHRVEPDSNNVSEPANIASNASTVRVKRRISVQINGSLHGLAQQGSVAGIWKPLDGKHVEIFGLDSHDGTPFDHGTMSNAMRNAVILKVTKLDHFSSFPVATGLTINCVSPQEVTDMGERYVCTMLPESKSSTPLVVFETDCASNDSIEWRNKYPNYNSSNLETFGVMDVQRCPYVFVHMNHPVIDLLRVNADMLGSNIDDQEPIDGQWFKVNRQVLGSCCNTLRNRVLSRVATRDLNSFSIQLHRVGNPHEWDAIGDGSELMVMAPPRIGLSLEDKKAVDAQYLEHQAKKPCVFMGTFELEYELQI